MRFVQKHGGLLQFGIALLCFAWGLGLVGNFVGAACVVLAMAVGVMRWQREQFRPVHAILTVLVVFTALFVSLSTEALLAPFWRGMLAGGWLSAALFVGGWQVKMKVSYRSYRGL